MTYKEWGKYVSREPFGPAECDLMKMYRDWGLAEEVAKINIKELLISCKELREVSAAAMRAMVTNAKTSKRWFAEIAHIGIPSGFGVRADMAIRNAETKE